MGGTTLAHRRGVEATRLVSHGGTTTGHLPALTTVPSQELSSP